MKIIFTASERTIVKAFSAKLDNILGHSVPSSKDINEDGKWGHITHTEGETVIDVKPECFADAFRIVDHVITSASMFLVPALQFCKTSYADYKKKWHKELPKAKMSKVTETAKVEANETVNAKFQNILAVIGSVKIDLDTTKYMEWHGMSSDLYVAKIYWLAATNQITVMVDDDTVLVVDVNIESMSTLQMTNILHNAGVIVTTATL